MTVHIACSQDRGCTHTNAHSSHSARPAAAMQTRSGKGGGFNTRPAQGGGKRAHHIRFTRNMAAAPCSGGGSTAAPPLLPPVEAPRFKASYCCISTHGLQKREQTQSPTRVPLMFLAVRTTPLNSASQHRDNPRGMNAQLEITFPPINPNPHRRANTPPAVVPLALGTRLRRQSGSAVTPSRSQFSLNCTHGRKRLMPSRSNP